MNYGGSVQTTLLGSLLLGWQGLAGVWNEKMARSAQKMARSAETMARLLNKNYQKWHVTIYGMLSKKIKIIISRPVQNGQIFEMWPQNGPPDNPVGRCKQAGDVIEPESGNAAAPDQAQKIHFEKSFRKC